MTKLKSTWVSCPKEHVNLRSSVDSNGGKCPQCGNVNLKEVPSPRFGPDAHGRNWGKRE